MALISIEHTNAIQWSTRMQKHFNFNEHVNAKVFQLSTQTHVIEHANAFHLARERISIEYANAKAFQLSFVLRHEHDMLFRVQTGAILVDLAMSTQGRQFTKHLTKLEIRARPDNRCAQCVSFLHRDYDVQNMLTYE